MTKFKKFYDEMWNWLPILWGILLTLIITAGGLALVVTTIKWLLIVLGVL